MLRERPSESIVGMRRLGKHLKSWKTPVSICNQVKVWKPCGSKRTRKATPMQRAECKRPNGSYSVLFRRSEVPKTTAGCGNAGAWKTRKTKSRFSVVSHRPWKSLLRFPHSRSPEGSGWKSGNPKAGFPLFHRTSLYRKSKLKRRPAERSLTAPSGSFFD